MLLELITLGVLDDGAMPDIEVGSGPVDLPIERLVSVSRLSTDAQIANGIPFGAPVWTQRFDPADHANFAIDFADLLDTGELIADVEAMRVSPAAAAMGVAIDTSEGFSPVIDSVSGQTVMLWLHVADNLQAAASFDAAGTRLAITMRIVSDAANPKRFERTAVIVMRQQ